MHQLLFSKQKSNKVFSKTTKPRITVCSRCMRSKSCTCGNKRDLKRILNLNKMRIKSGKSDIAFNENYSYDDPITKQKIGYDVNFKNFAEIEPITNRHDFSEQYFYEDYFSAKKGATNRSAKSKPAKAKPKISKVAKKVARSPPVTLSAAQQKALTESREAASRKKMLEASPAYGAEQRAKALAAQQQQLVDAIKERQKTTGITAPSDAASIAALESGQVQGGFDTPQEVGLVSNYLGRTNAQIGEFEQMFPKQTAQLIKMGQDLTYFGKKVTDIDDTLARHQSKFKYYDEKLPYLDHKISAEFPDIHSKLEQLGKSTSDASKGAGLGQLLGGIGTTGLLIIGGVLLFITLRK